MVPTRFSGMRFLSAGAEQPPAALTHFDDMNNSPSLVSAIARTKLKSSNRRRVSICARPLSGVNRKMPATGEGLRSTIR